MTRLCFTLARLMTRLNVFIYARRRLYTLGKPLISPPRRRQEICVFAKKSFAFAILKIHQEQLLCLGFMWVFIKKRTGTGNSVKL